MPIIFRMAFSPRLPVKIVEAEDALLAKPGRIARLKRRDLGSCLLFR